MTAMMPEPTSTGMQCGYRLHGGVMEYPCTLERGHIENNDGEPHFAVEAPKSVHEWQSWRKAQDARLRIKHDRDPYCPGYLVVDESTGIAICDQCGARMEVAGAKTENAPEQHERPEPGPNPPLGPLDTVVGWNEVDDVDAQPDHGYPEVSDLQLRQVEAAQRAEQIVKLLDDAKRFDKGLLDVIDKSLDKQAEEIKARPIATAVRNYLVEWSRTP